MDTMQNMVADKISIMELMNGWMHRDAGNWDELRVLFVPEGEIVVSWYEGAIDGFIEGSKKLFESEVVSKHFIGMPLMKFNGDKCLTQTNAQVMTDNTSLGFGSNLQVRFVDMIVRRDGQWKILKRQVIYDMGTFTFPRGPVEIDTKILDQFPRAYAPMAYGIGKTGVTYSRIFATKGSDLEKKMLNDAEAWLGS